MTRMLKHMDRTLIRLAIVIIAAWAFTRVYAGRVAAERDARAEAPVAAEAAP